MHLRIQNIRKDVGNVITIKALEHKSFFCVFGYISSINKARKETFLML